MKNSLALKVIFPTHLITIIFANRCTDLTENTFVLDEAFSIVIFPYFLYNCFKNISVKH